MTLLRANATNCSTCAYMKIIHDEKLSSKQMESKYPGMTLYKNGAAYECTNNMNFFDEDGLKLCIAYSFSGRKISCTMYSHNIST